ncbi:MAG TPA: class I SAM-dependent methyltransferase [Thermoanaerobaculia bacterium]|nr:class I SAM-dependent methyltransferase [Thermoanaerobaculia bacterium]
MTSFWDREVIERQHFEWMALEQVRLHINAMIGGSELRWPIEWLEWWLRGRTFDRALSVGCGAGVLERQLIQRGLCKHVDAFDASIASLHIAVEAARELPQIRYFAADFNHVSFPRRVYDVVFFHQSAHHVRRLERLFAQLLRALKPDGLIYFDEYVGPSRFEWNEERIAPQQAFFEAIPRHLRAVDRLAFPIQPDDPTEAIRSSSIEPALRIGFEVLARRPYGGTLLSLVLPQMRSIDEALPYCIGCERALLAAGVPSFYALLVALPKPVRILAQLRYAFVRLKMRLRSLTRT